MTNETNQLLNEIFEGMLNNECKTIKLDLTACMGGGTAGLTTFRKVRKGKARKVSYGGGMRIRGRMTRQFISLLSEHQTKFNPVSGYRIWRNQYEDGTVSFSASVGNMGLIIDGCAK